MIYGLYSKEYTGLISDPTDSARVICESSFDQGQGDLKLEFTVDGGADWHTVLNTGSSIDLIGEELLIPSGSQGNNFQFRAEIDISSTIKDIDTAGNVTWGRHPKSRPGEQVNIYRFSDDERETFTVTGSGGLWKAELPPGYYYYFYDFQNSLTKDTLPSDQYLVVGSGDISNVFGEETQVTFKKSDEVYLSNTFISFSWSKYLVTDLGLQTESQKRDLSQYSDDVRIRHGRLFKGDAFFEFIGFIIGKT